MLKYKILKDPANLSYQTESFFKLPKNVRKVILDKYFKKFRNVSGLELYFTDKNSRYYDDGREITFFHFYYFDKLLLEYNPENIRLIDEFVIEKEKRDYLVTYTLELIRDRGITLTSRELVSYPDDLPKFLSSNLEFMEYLVHQDEGNIKYITYQDKNIKGLRDLIQKGIVVARTRDFNIKKFLKNDGSLPRILETNHDFLLYLIENNIENIYYLDEGVVENTTISNQQNLINTIIEALRYKEEYIDKLENISYLANILNTNIDFLRYIISVNIDNIQYIDWYNLTDFKKDELIRFITDKIKNSNIEFDIMEYPARELFFQNKYFMKYLIDSDFRWIAVSEVEDIQDNHELIELFFEKSQENNYRFRLSDFLIDNEYINHRLIEDRDMLEYFFQNKVKVIQYIDFFRLKSSRDLVDNILREIEKKEFEFHNDDFLVNGKYPIPLSNSYRFMRYVIDKNFNNLAYIDLSMIDEHELKRIINYACRMVYYIRGKNKNLNFDIDGYFKDSDILDNEYFQECLSSL